jgi:hypothetical protein
VKEQRVDKLTEDEMNQLKTLLIRYLAYHAEGIFNMAVDALLARFKASPSLIDVTPVPEQSPPTPVKRKRSQQG